MTSTTHSSPPSVPLAYAAEPTATAGDPDSSTARPIPRCVATLRAQFHCGTTRPLAWRKQQLQALALILQDHHAAIAEAIHYDTGRPAHEASLEVGNTRSHVLDLIKNLSEYTAKKKAPTILPAFPGKSYILTEPLGVVLVISSWNFPIELSLLPLAGAIAAGNCAVLKPSEVAPHTSTLLAQILSEALEQGCVRVIEGGVDETTELLEQCFDHIFYTGSARVGRIVLRAAAEHLTPVTLELGGKNPVIVDKDCQLDVTARRIVWGKFFNTGQVCVNADYLLVHRDIYPQLLAALKRTILEFYGDDPQKSPDYGRIVNAGHFQRLLRLLDSRAHLAHGGENDPHDKYIAPTLLTDVPLDAAIMQEEIFGPLLPLIPVKSIDEAIAFVAARPKPLALYYFGENSINRDAVLSRTSSGGAAVNQILYQMLGPHLPFGGVGASGMGAYHGRHSVHTFSHQKSVVDRPTYFDPRFAYPPSNASKSKWIKRLV